MNNSSVRFSREYLVGTLFLIGSALLSSVNQVYYAIYIQNLDPFAFTFVSFLLSAVIFNLIVMFSKQPIVFGERSNRKNIISLNVSTAVAFLGFFYALKFVEPAIVSAIEIGVGPLITLLLGKFFNPKKKLRGINLIIGAGILLGSLLLFWASLTGRSGIEFNSIYDMSKGMFASIICGLGAVMAAIYSKRLSEAGWSSTKILAHRFYAIVPISAIFAFANGSLNTILLENWMWIMIVTITGVVLPLYMLQVGIRFCDPFFVMISITFIPAFTFIFQLFDPRIVWSNVTLCGVVTLLVFALLSVVIENNPGRKKFHELQK
jgi:drug/metabolite transporter (DMT)-like permease